MLPTIEDVTRKPRPERRRAQPAPSPWRGVAGAQPGATPGQTIAGALAPPPRALTPSALSALAVALATKAAAPDGPPAAGPKPHHLDDSYVGYGTPNLEWWGPNPDPRYSDWKADYYAGARQHYRRDYRPGSNLTYGEA